MRLHRRIVQHENILYPEKVHVKHVQHDHINERHRLYIIQLQQVVQHVDDENGVMPEVQAVVI